jgi:hypothetical protein
MEGLLLGVVSAILNKFCASDLARQGQFVPGDLGGLFGACPAHLGHCVCTL